MNLMVLSPGRKVQLIKKLKTALNQQGRKLLALDMSSYAPALYFADQYFVIEKDFHNLVAYINKVIEICVQAKVSHVMTFIDPELSLLAQYRQQFAQHNITLIISANKEIAATLDKNLFYSTYGQDLNLIKTYQDYAAVQAGLNKKEIEFPLIVKPQNGSASEGLHKIGSAVELARYQNQPGFVFQPVIQGKELGIDAYFDLITGKLVSVFMKEKLAMRAGETDKAVSIYRADVLAVIEKLGSVADFCGPLDIDMFIADNGELLINEINPRFGGGYIQAHYCGVNFVDLIVKNVLGQANMAKLGEYKLGVIMMKSNKFIFKIGEKIDEE